MTIRFRAIPALVLPLLLLPAMRCLAATPVSFAGRPGMVLQYRLDYHNSAASDLQPVFQGISEHAPSQPPPSLKRTVEAAIRGDLRLLVLARDKGGVLVSYQLRNPTVRLSVDGRQAGHEEEVIRSVLATGVVVSRSPEGKILGVSLPAGVGLTPQGVVKTLLALTQVVLPAPAAVPAQPWETIEDEQDGRYRIVYTPLKRGALPGAEGTVVIAKEKRQHLVDAAPRLSSRQRLPVTYLPTGTLLVVMDEKQGVVREIQGSEAAAIQVGTRQVGTSRTDFSMVLTRSFRAPGTMRARLLKAHAARSVQAPPTPLRIAPTNDESDLLLYRQKLGSDTLASLTQQLRVADSATPDGIDETELYLKLKAVVFLDPAAPETLGALATAAGTASVSMKLVVGALASVGTPAAQEALCAIIMRHRPDRAFILQVIPLLGMFEAPVARTEETLRELAYTPAAEEVMMTAQLSIGSLAYRLAALAPDRAQRLIDEFMQRYGAARDQDEIGRVTLVLGNAALASSLPTLLAYSSDDRPAVRADGIGALRLYSAPEARARVRQALLSDPSAAVRASAANSLGYMKMSSELVSEMIAAFPSETDYQVRSEMFQSLWKSVREYPDILAFSRRIAESDPSEELRKAVRGRLDGYRPD